MTRVHTGSRLHFGLFDLRHFGGVGMMIDEPNVTVSARTTSEWTIAGELPARISFVVDRLRQHIPNLPPMRVEVTHAPPEHVGFGVGTQSTLALATAIVHEAGRDISTLELASLLGRGQRSAIGVHGFMHGGLLMDMRKHDDTLSPLAKRIELPGDWHILLVTPAQIVAWSGERERDAFAELTQHDDGDDSLRELAVNVLLPAAIANDIGAFGAALTEYNAKAGELFSPVQGSRYASSEVTEIVRQLLDLGLTGVGQSSWGPTVFAFCNDCEKLRHIGKSLASKNVAVRTVRPRNVKLEIQQGIRS